MIESEQQIQNELAAKRPDKHEKANQILKTWQQADTVTDCVEEDVAIALRELVNQFGYTHPYLDGDHGLGVVNISDINLVIESFMKSAVEIDG